MKQEQKELILQLLSSSVVDKKEGLARLQRTADVPSYEVMYQKEMKLIEDTYKEIDRRKCDD